MSIVSVPRVGMASGASIKSKNARKANIFAFMDRPVSEMTMTSFRATACLPMSTQLVFSVSILPVVSVTNGKIMATGIEAFAPTVEFVVSTRTGKFIIMWSAGSVEL